MYGWEGKSQVRSLLQVKGASPLDPLWQVLVLRLGRKPTHSVRKALVLFRVWPV